MNWASFLLGVCCGSGGVMAIDLITEVLYRRALKETKTLSSMQSEEDTLIARFNLQEDQYKRLEERVMTLEKKVEKNK